MVYPFTARGTAAPTKGVLRVEVSSDGSTWDTASGTDEWSFQMGLSFIAHGANTLWVRAYDGQNYSSTITVNYTYDGVPSIGDYNLTMGLDSVLFTGTASDDGDNIVRVEMRIDYGDWATVNGTTDWDLEVDLGTLTHGDHIAEVRAHDGNNFSEVINRTFTVNHRPELDVAGDPTPSEEGGVLAFNGTATDSVGVVMISYRVDGGEWTNVTTTGDWTFQVDTGGMAPGQHTVEIRAYDGQAYSDTYTYTIDIGSHTEEESDPMVMIMVAVGVLVLVVLATLVGLRRRR